MAGAKQGGIEIVDITDPAQPVEIGLVSNIGEAHTVNVDPKRPHIVYASTSDSVGVSPQGVRSNEDPASGDRFNLDGFEVIDISSCMGFTPGTTVAAKRAACRPEVFRYRYPTWRWPSGTRSRTTSTRATSSRSIPTTSSPAAAATR